MDRPAMFVRPPLKKFVSCPAGGKIVANFFFSLSLFVVVLLRN